MKRYLLSSRPWIWMACVLAAVLTGCGESGPPSGVIVNENNSTGASLILSDAPFVRGEDMIVSLEPISMAFSSGWSVRVVRILPDGKKSFAPSDGTFAAQCGKYEVVITHRGEIVFRETVDYTGEPLQRIYAQKEFEVFFVRNDMGGLFGL